MKTIKEAAKEYAKKAWSKYANPSDYNLNGSELDFKEGVKFAQRWIPIDEELPNECTFVLTKYKNTYSVSWYDGEFNEMYNPTHWRPIEIK